MPFKNSIASLIYKSFATAASGARWVIQGDRQDSRTLSAYSGDPSETAPGTISVGSAESAYAVIIKPPRYLNWQLPTFELRSASVADGTTFKAGSRIYGGNFHDVNIADGTIRLRASSPKPQEFDAAITLGSGTDFDDGIHIDASRFDLLGNPIAGTMVTGGLSIDGLTIGNSPWIDLPLPDGLVPWDSVKVPAVRIENGNIVRLRGWVKPSVGRFPVGTNVIGILPVGYRPVYTQGFAVAHGNSGANSTGNTVRVEVSSEGSLSAVPNASYPAMPWISLDGIVFGLT